MSGETSFPYSPSMTTSSFVVSAALLGISGSVFWYTLKYGPSLPTSDSRYREVTPLAPKGMLNETLIARIDDGSDDSYLSKSLVAKLGLEVIPLTEDDREYNATLGDSSKLPVAGKVTLQWRGKNSESWRPIYKFHRGEYTDDFYVPAERDIAFAMIIGQDIIDRYGLNKRYLCTTGPVTAAPDKRMSEAAQEKRKAEIAQARKAEEAKEAAKKEQGTQSMSVHSNQQGNSTSQAGGTNHSSRI